MKVIALLLLKVDYGLITFESYLKTESYFWKLKSKYDGNIWKKSSILRNLKYNTIYHVQMGSQNRVI